AGLRAGVRGLPPGRLPPLRERPDARRDVRSLCPARPRHCVRRLDPRSWRDGAVCRDTGRRCRPSRRMGARVSGREVPRRRDPGGGPHGRQCDGRRGDHVVVRRTAGGLCPATDCQHAAPLCHRGGDGRILARLFLSPEPDAMSGAGQLVGREKSARELVTPEGVDLRIVLADAGARISAFLLDVLFIVLSLTALTLLLIAIALASVFVAAEYLAILWLLGFFFLRVFYFTAFEMAPRAATWGKRIVGIRVASRDGGALSADAIFARNAMRELELFLPLSFLVAQKETVDAWIYLLATLWCGVFVLFPLFNRDRLRVGDIVAGTWVVRAPKRILGRDLLDRPVGPALAFTREQLDAYGIRELSVLEDVLRHSHAQTMRAVAERIRGKIGMTSGREPDAEFLQAYYRALRGRLESRLLFGKRKADKFDRS